MNLDENIPTGRVIAMLRRWIAELEDLEAKGAATPDTGRMLVDLYQLLDKLDVMMLKRARDTLQ
ncbi:MAG TPA: hypothetical protein VME69_04335 [Methylocella sp.]|nr:hypothetical protein [Methylocella sp.]